MHQLTPHTTLLALHQLIDAALTPLLEPLTVRWTTESYLTVDASDLHTLARDQQPHAALVAFDGNAIGPSLVIAEPSLSAAMLTRLWRSSRNQGAPLTQVEGEIVRQFVANVVAMWRAGWAGEGLSILPKLSMAATLPILMPQTPDGPWHVARTLVSDEADAPIGVLLFCYPAHLLPLLERERTKLTWRSRIERGLTPAERERLGERLNTTLREVTLNAPVTFDTEVPIGVINALERGDVIDLGIGAGEELDIRVLDRDVCGALARSGANLAFALTGAYGADDHDTDDDAEFDYDDLDHDYDDSSLEPDMH